MREIAVIGGGVSGLAAAWNLRDLEGARVRVYEATERTGGKIVSESVAGLLIESGPNGYLNSEPATERLIASLGLIDELESASKRSDTRFLYHQGRLRPLPTSPLAFLSSPLLSLPARLRVPFEFFKGPGPDQEETVREFVSRRLGPEMAEVMIDAMVSGIYAGDIDALSISAAFPRLLEIEARYGGLFKGMRAIRKERRAAGEQSGPTGQPRGRLTAFKRGMGTLPERLRERLSAQIETGRALVDLEQLEGGYLLHFKQGEPVEIDELILALPAPALAQILKGLAPSASAALSQIPYVGVTVVALAFERAAVSHSLEGFGFLAPRCEGLRALGVRFASSTFEGRSPEDQVLLEVLIGGAHDAEAIELGDDELLALLLDELREPLGLNGEPKELRFYRHEQAIPQYTLGHLERLTEIEAALAGHPRLQLASNALYGVAMNKCLLRAEEVAQALLQQPSCQRGT